MFGGGRCWHDCSRTERLVRHEWGVLGTASAAFSHNEGNIVGLQFKAKGQEAITVTNLQLGSPVVCINNMHMCGCVTCAGSAADRVLACTLHYE